MKTFQFLVLACVLLVASAPAFAWHDTAVKAQQPLPLVEEFPVATLSGVPQNMINTDPEANGGQNGKAVTLAPDGGVSLTVQKELPISVYSLWAIGRAAKPFDAAKRPAAFFTLQVTNLQTKETKSWAMQIAYLETYEAIARIYFPVNVAGEYSMTMSLDPKSEMTFLVDRLELRDALGNTVREAIKTRRILTSDDELTKLRSDADVKANRSNPLNAYKKMNPLPPLNWPTGSLMPERTQQQRIAEANTLWDAMPDFNIATSVGGTPYAWIIGRDRPGVIADGARIYQIYNDKEVAWDASIVLAGLAEKYPGLDYNVQNKSSKQGFLNADPFQFSGGFKGKYVYSGWAPNDAQRIAEAYDKLFDYIKDNQLLADFIGTKIAWVKTPQDVIKLIDVYFLQSAEDANFRRQIRSDKLSAFIPLILGPGKVSNTMLERGLFGKVHENMTDAGGMDDQIFTSYSRDGVRYIGSVGYISDELRDIAEMMHQYVEVGGNPKFDLLDPEKYPQLLGARRTIEATSVAGGFPLIIGDARDLHAGRLNADFPSYPSRVLGGFGVAILEDGQSATNAAVKRAVAVHTGMGVGHAHQDSLNLDITALGTRLAPDLGGRHEGKLHGSPNMRSNRSHNVVEVDDKDFENIVPGSTTSATGWNRLFSPALGSQVMINASRATSHPNVSLYERLTAMIDGPVTDELAPIYVFDVFRVAGGHIHTYAFHGAESQKFETNVPMKPATSPEAVQYLRKHKEGTREEGKAPAVLQADWELMDANAKRWLGTVDENARRHTKLSLFGQDGDDVFVGNAYSVATYNYDFPFLYVQKRGEEGMQSTFPAIIETYAGQPFIASQRELKVTPNKQGATQAVGMEVVLKNGRHDLLYAGGDQTTLRQMEGGLSAAGEFGFFSEDANGLRAMHLAGGVSLQKSGIGIIAAQPEYTGKLDSVDHANRMFEVNASIPPAALINGAALIGDTAHNAEFNLQKATSTKTGTQIQTTETSQFYQSEIIHIDPKTNSVETELEPTIIRADPVYYNGAFASNEAGTKFWKTKLVSDERWMYIAWPGYRTSWPDRISMAEIPDSNGDGKHELKMIGSVQRDKDKKGQVLVTLEVTRVSDDGRTIFFKMPEDPYFQTGGWQFAYRTLVNEDGSKTWRSMYAGTSYRFILDGPPVTQADFADADGDGKSKLKIYHFGPGSGFTLPTHVAVKRVVSGEWEVRANVACTLMLPGKGKVQIKTDDGDWKPIESQQKDNVVTLKIINEMLSVNPLQLKVGG